MRGNSIEKQKVTIIHSVSHWLPQTENWIYTQVKSLPLGIESHIVCETVENLDQLSVPNIHSLCEVPLWRYLWDKGLRKLGVRNHLDFLVEKAKGYHAQVLHSHFGHAGWANIGVAKQAGLKHVVTFYGFDVSYLPTLDSRWHKR